MPRDGPDCDIAAPISSSARYRCRRYGSQLVHQCVGRLDGKHVSREFGELIPRQTLQRQPNRIRPPGMSKPIDYVGSQFRLVAAARHEQRECRTRSRGAQVGHQVHGRRVGPMNVLYNYDQITPASHRSKHLVHRGEEPGLLPLLAWGGIVRRGPTHHLGRKPCQLIHGMRRQAGHHARQRRMADRAAQSS